MSDIDATSTDLSPRQSALMTSLLTGMSLDEAAKSARISVRTANRYLKNTAFRDCLRKLQQEQLTLVVTQSHGIGDKAVKVLQSISDDPTAPATARVSASRHLDARRWIALEHANLQSQLDEIRALLTNREFES